MNRDQRNDFRKSDKWKQFKYKIRLKCSRDWITKEPLARDWNLHHLDLNTKRYDQIDDMNRFMPLNPKTHKLIHELFKLYRKDHKVLERITKVLEKMEVYTNEV